MEVDEKPTEDYSDIGGLDKQIQELREAIVLPITHKVGGGWCGVRGAGAGGSGCVGGVWGGGRSRQQLLQSPRLLESGDELWALAVECLNVEARRH